MLPPALPKSIIVIIKQFSNYGLKELLNKFHSKAAEFERLLQSKSAASNISDSAKIVICLDLAASVFHSDVELVRIIHTFRLLHGITLL